MAAASVASNTSRKRARHASPAPLRSKDASASPSHSLADLSDAFFSPAPLATSRYRLAGGQESPSASAMWAESPCASGVLSDAGFRRGRPYTDRPGELGRSGSTETLPVALAREANGRPRAVSSATQASAASGVHGRAGGPGLGTALYATVSGVVGRVWTFCTAGSFRGFFAGGGKGYAMDASATEGSWYDVGAASMPELPPQPARPQPRGRDFSARHVPGGFPASSSPPRPRTPAGADSESDAADTRASKRSRRSYAGADVYGSPSASWVLVRDPRASRASPGPASRPSSRASLRRSQAPAPAAAPQLERALLGATGGVASGHARRASAAGLRSPRASPAHSRQNSAAGTPAAGQRASLGPRQGESPIAVETARFVKGIKRAERREDREISRMNRTLQDMIREAKEALGTKVDVEMDDESDEW